jgi:hypothetical protein
MTRDFSGPRGDRVPGPGSARAAIRPERELEDHIVGAAAKEIGNVTAQNRSQSLLESLSCGHWGLPIHVCFFSWSYELRRLFDTRFGETQAHTSRSLRAGTGRAGGELRVSPSGLASWRSRSLNAAMTSVASKARLRLPTVTL